MVPPSQKLARGEDVYCRCVFERSRRTKPRDVFGRLPAVLKPIKTAQRVHSELTPSLGPLSTI